ncbi:MAG: ThiF family adenylyltransferase [Chloroflexi bacterium]|nr:ThiF family adenylyltransferase [Chloroflexota bacterium]
MSVDYWRQTDLVTPEHLRWPVAVVGVGGIGSPTTLALAKMGCRRLSIYDPDTVEPHNLPSQLYRLDDVGRPKVEALAEVVRAFTSAEVRPVQERVAGPRLDGIVVAAVDSMASREAIWRESVRYRAAIPLFVDARMGAQVCRLLTIRPTDPDDVRFYESTLYTDEAALDEPCTAQAIVYTTFGVAALVASQVRRFVTGEALNKDVIFDFVTLSLIVA